MKNIFAQLAQIANAPTPEASEKAALDAITMVQDSLPDPTVIDNGDNAELAQAIEFIEVGEALSAGELYNLIDASKGAKYAHCFDAENAYIGDIRIRTLKNDPDETTLSFGYEVWGVDQISSFYTSKSWRPSEFFDENLIWDEDSSQWEEREFVEEREAYQSITLPLEDALEGLKKGHWDKLTCEDQECAEAALTALVDHLNEIKAAAAEASAQAAPASIA